MSEARALAALCQAVGGDLLLTQGGGGNASVKSADRQRMWIKASGLRMAQVRPDHGSLAAHLPALLAVMHDPALIALAPAEAHVESVRRIQAATIDAGGLRPSLETTFHAVLGPYVLHTHPVYLNAFTCMLGGRELLAEALGEQPVWVDYAAPGYALGQKVNTAVQAHVRDSGHLPAIILLENHGLIVSGDSADVALAGTARLVEAAQAFFGPLPADACRAAQPPAELSAWAAELSAALARRGPERSGQHPLVVRPARFAGLLGGGPRAAAGGALVPDDVVYNGPRLWLSDSGAPEAWLRSNPDAWPGVGRLAIAVEQLGVVLAGASAGFVDALEENLLAHVLVRQLIARRGHPRCLPSADVETLLRMESEAYRQSIAAGPPPGGAARI